jgi:outer membrane lipoprotein carrier protein
MTSGRSRVTLAALVAMTGFAWPAHAGGIEQLKAFVETTRSAKATFRQTTSDKSGRKAQNASGTFQFARPGRFRWTYEQPFDQVIVGDGAQVWIWDRDLNQVIVRRMSQALGSTPAALLAGDNALEKNFVLTDGGRQADLDWVDAKPRSTESGFERVRIGFRDNLPRAMELLDAFGQTTQLVFPDIERNAPLAAELFRFVPPPGADVIGER